MSNKRTTTEREDNSFVITFLSFDRVMLLFRNSPGCQISLGLMNHVTKSKTGIFQIIKKSLQILKSISIFNEQFCFSHEKHLKWEELKCASA